MWGEEQLFSAFPQKAGKVFPIERRADIPLSEGPLIFRRINDRRWERFYAGRAHSRQIFKYYQEGVPHACLVMIEDFVEKPATKT